jgi:hypothetical protein
VLGKIGGWIWCKKSAHMYVNAKMILVETIPEMWGGGKVSGERGEFKYDIFDTL